MKVAKSDMSVQQMLDKYSKEGSADVNALSNLHLLASVATQNNVKRFQNRKHVRFDMQLCVHEFETTTEAIEDSVDSQRCIYRDDDILYTHLVEAELNKLRNSMFPLPAPKRFSFNLCDSALSLGRL